MKTSTPNKQPVRELREAAVAEINGTKQVEVDLDFDTDHSKTEANDEPAETFDSNNGVANYPGQNIEHIGNGTGGIR